MDFNMKRGRLDAERSIQAAAANHPALRPEVPEVAQLSASTMQSLQSHIENNFQAPKSTPLASQQIPAPQASYAQVSSPIPQHVVEKPYAKLVEPSKPTYTHVVVEKKPSLYSQLSSNPNFVSPFSLASTPTMPYTSSLASAKSELIDEPR